MTTITPSTQTSQDLFTRACAVMPGGVSSPVRAYQSVGGQPFFIASGSGCHVRTEDGNEYLDFVGSWGPLILGHAHPAVTSAVQKAVALGTSFGAPCLPETELAEKICAMSPVLDKVRFVNSGTEATMSALRLARAVTGRDGFIKFDGCYHGHADSFLVKAGSGLATFGESSSAGVPTACSALTGVLPLDNEKALEEWFAANGDQTAAVFVEGIPANCGLLPQRKEWWKKLREVTRAHGTLLVVDEVITGFRVAPGGFCSLEGIDADLVTYGKIIGGGLPVGAYGGRKDLMDRICPDGNVYQAGTLSGNPLCMAAGIAALDAIVAQDGWQRLEQLGSHWERLLQPLLAREIAAGHPLTLTRRGSLFWLCFDATEAPRTFAAIPSSGAKRFARFFHELLSRSIMIAPSAYEVGFLNLAMDEEILTQAAVAFGEALEASR
jgi:glutamate-1-semialdehyde 2,1-aminomutase